jgi:hypothetical protein
VTSIDAESQLSRGLQMKLAKSGLSPNHLCSCPRKSN